MASLDMEALVNRASGEELDGFPKTKIVCTLGPKSRDVATIERLLRAGMSVARFNFSHGSHEYHQGTLDNLRIAQQNTQIMCAVMLDTKVSMPFLLISPNVCYFSLYLRILQNFLPIIHSSTLGQPQEKAIVCAIRAIRWSINYAFLNYMCYLRNYCVQNIPLLSLSRVDQENFGEY